MYDGKSDTLYLAWSAERRGCRERKRGGGMGKRREKRTSVLLFRGLCAGTCLGMEQSWRLCWWCPHVINRLCVSSLAVAPGLRDMITTSKTDACSSVTTLTSHHFHLPVMKTAKRGVHTYTPSMEWPAYQWAHGHKRRHLWLAPWLPGLSWWCVMCPRDNQWSSHMSCSSSTYTMALVQTWVWGQGARDSGACLVLALAKCMCPGVWT